MKQLFTSFLLLILFAPAAFSQPCIGSQSLTASPPPSPGGTYPNGTLVTFCYTVTDYSQTSAEWLCGIVPTFGPGWDLTTLQPISAANSCDGLGYWGWFNTCTSTNSGLTFGPGFYYDTPSGATTGMLDSIPGNNFGDNCVNFTWVFCFSVEVGNSNIAPSGTDLTVSITAYGDNLSGSWGGVGCSDPPTTNGSPTVYNCALIVPTINVTDVTCATATNGAISVFPQGVAPYSYQWSNGATSQTITNLAPGIYTLTVTDTTSCTKTVTIPVGSPAAIALNPVVTPNGCNTTGGSVTLNPTGGLGSIYTYQWSDGSTAAAITNLSGGTYSVTVTDSTGCTQTGSWIINTLTPVSLSTSFTPSLCNGPNGSATALVTGGNGPVTYLWSPGGQTSAIVTGLTGGTYSVTVTDSAGCFANSTVIIPAINDLAAVAYGDTTVCSGETVSFGAQITGGTLPYTYLWSNGNTGATITLSPAVAGSYVVTVSDINGCITNDTVMIGIVDYPVVNISPGTTICYGSSTQLVATGGTTYSWSPPDYLSGTTIPDPIANPVSTTTYTVSSANGTCVTTASVTVNVEPEVVASFTPDSTQGDAPFTVTFSSNSSGFMSAVWDFGDGSDTTVTTSGAVGHTYAQQGSYVVSLIVTNNFGCTDTAVYSFIIVNEYSAIFIPSVFTPNGDGYNDEFKLEEDKLSAVEVVILNRWGKEVVSWNKLNGSWNGNGGDGDELPDGTYFYVVKARGVDAKEYQYQGTVKLLRTN
jgi:gliding motility-associated-like protein